MHNAVKDFLKQVRRELPHKFRFRRVLEVGSKSINGSPRKYFWFCKYTGVDLSVGKGVDIVGNINDELIMWEKLELNYEVVISTEMLEHDKNYKQSLLTMYDLLKRGGLMIITCASDHRKEHGTSRTNPECSPDTNDYYHNISVDEFREILPEHLFETYVVMNARGKNDLQFYGIKPYKK